MKLIYCKIKDGNFGDDLNPWLWDKFIPGAFNEDTSVYFVGIGTLLCDYIPKQGLKIIFGSGAGYRTLPSIDSTWKFYCVRGPLTANALGLKPELAVTDPAALVAALDLPKPNKEHKISFMPHHLSAYYLDWSKLCQGLNVNYIDSRWSVERVIDALLKTEVLVTEAMHGAILSDAFRIPWVPVKIYEHILEKKWEDWCLSMEIKYNPIRIKGVFDSEYNYPLIDRWKNKIKRGFLKIGMLNSKRTLPPLKSKHDDKQKFFHEMNCLFSNLNPYLSNDLVMDHKINRLLFLIEQFKKDYL